MAAASLKHYTSDLSTTSVFTPVAAVASARALVISKLVIAASAASNVTIKVGANEIATALPLTAGQVYTETGLVAITGDTVTVQASVANALKAHVFGEEIDT